MVEASYAPGPNCVLTPAVAIWRTRTASWLTLAASEGVWLTCSLSRVGDKWVLFAGVPQFTGAEQGAVEDACLAEVIIFIGMVICLPILAEYVLVAQC